MLVIAQGIATTVAPYLHLGYLAAYSDPMPPGFEYVHIPLVVGLGLGAAVVYKGLPAVLRGQRPRGLGLSVIACLLCLALVWGIRAGPGPPPEEVTRARAGRIVGMFPFQVPSPSDPPITSLHDPRVNLPQYYYSVPGVAPSYSGPWFGDVCTDYWGKEFQVRSRVKTLRWSDGGNVTRAAKGYEYWLISAGPDGQFGTADDLVCAPKKR